MGCGAHRIAGDDLIDEVAAGEVAHRDHEHAGGDKAEPERAHLLPPPPTCEPDRANPACDGEDPDEVRDLLQPVGHLLGRVQIMRLENRDLPGVLWNLVCKVADEAEPVPQPEHERSDVENDVAVRRIYRLRISMEHVDELLLR